MSEEILGKQQTEPKLDRGTPKKKKGFNAFAVFAQLERHQITLDVILFFLLRPV